jgi:hypothetical protein
MDKCEAFKNVERSAIRPGKTGVCCYSRSTFLSGYIKIPFLTINERKH